MSSAWIGVGAAALLGFTSSRAEAGGLLPERLVRDTITYTYLYPLAGWTGPLRSSNAVVSFDPATHETIVVTTQDSSVRVFNDHGMEIYRFGSDEALGGIIISVAVLPDGDLLVLTNRDERISIRRCNFRGEPRATLELSNVPEGFTRDFAPSKVVARSGLIYLADVGAMKILVVDTNGVAQRALQLAKMLDLTAAEQRDNQIFDVDVDRAGNIYFTIPTLFRVFVLAPSNELTSFGTKGSAPGRFNVVCGVTADDDGNIYATDVLRAVVLVFDRDFNFRGEFGYRGSEVDNLSGPRSIAVGDGKVFVSQGASRGVSVFGVRVLPPKQDGEGNRTRVGED